MAQKRAKFQLNDEVVEQICELIGDEFIGSPPGATPAQICRELNIHRRTFNSLVSNALFSKRPTKPQIKLRIHIMDMIYNQVCVTEIISE